MKLLQQLAELYPVVKNNITRNHLTAALTGLSIALISAAPAPAGTIPQTEAVASTADDAVPAAPADKVVQQQNDANFVNVMRLALHVRTPGAVLAAQQLLNTELPADKQVATDGKYQSLPIQVIAGIALNRNFDTYHALLNPRLTDAEFLSVRQAAMPYQGMARSKLTEDQRESVRAYQRAVNNDITAESDKIVVDGVWGNRTDLAEATMRAKRVEAFANTDGGRLVLAASAFGKPETTVNPFIPPVVRAAPAPASYRMGDVVGENAFIKIGNGGHGATDTMRMRSASRAHFGNDNGAPAGTPITSLFDEAIVQYAGVISGGGLSVILTSPTGVTLRLMHCSRLNVRKNDVLKRGDKICAVGGSGTGRGGRLVMNRFRPHAHVEAFLYANGTIYNVDPDLAAEHASRGKDLRQASIVRDIVRETESTTRVRNLSRQAIEIESRTGLDRVQLASYALSGAREEPLEEPRIQNASLSTWRAPRKQVVECVSVPVIGAAPSFMPTARYSFRQAAAPYQMRSMTIGYGNAKPTGVVVAATTLSCTPRLQ